MLFQLLCDTIYKVLTSLLGWIEIPNTDVFSDLLNFVNLVINNGIGIFKFFIPEKFLFFGLTYVIALESCKLIWSLVMFILRKIPMVGIN